MVGSRRNLTSCPEGKSFTAIQWQQPTLIGTPHNYFQFMFLRIKENPNMILEKKRTFGGTGRTRTYEVVRREIYSLLQ
jgi:hypothetical protein